MTTRAEARPHAARAVLTWSALALVLAIPFGFAVTSPLLAYRDGVYIGAGVAGIAALGLLLIQPLLILGVLPGLRTPRARHVHRLVGTTLAGLLVVHVAGLWITSPPDVVDALLFTSPTPFSAWGVIAMWALFASAALATRRRRFHPRTWRRVHGTLALAIVAGTIVHALLIEGTMETVSKIVLCGLVAGATGWAFMRLPRRRSRV
ncbi:ferric reductase-like transmembrane domain-containing protein [Roseivivax sp. CAU 1753]